MTRALKKYWPLLGICLLLIVLGLYLIEVRNLVSEEPLTTDANLEEGLKLENIHYTQDNADQGMKWTLDAEEVRFSKNREFFSFMKFRLKLERENSPSVVLLGKRGHYDKNSGKIDLHGDLQAFTDNGYKIITEHLLYRQKEGYMETEGPVRILGPFFSLAGRGLYFNPEKETLKIISDVTTHINGDSVVL